MTATVNASTTSGVIVTSDTSGSLALQTANTTALTIDSSQNVGLGVTPSSWASYTGVLQMTGGALAGYTGGNYLELLQNAYYASGYKYVNTGYASKYQQDTGAHKWYVAPSGTAGNAITFTQALAVGKGTTLVLEGGTSSSGTGIAFPATQSASTDANTLDDYEEGTWTPNQGAGLTVVGTFSSTGKYTKIGRVVTVQGSFSATSITVNGNTVMCSNLPFPNMNVSASNFIGGASNAALSALINVWVDQPATSMYAVSSMAGTAGIYFTVTYFTT